MIKEEEAKMLKGADNLIDMKDNEGIELIKSEDYKIKEQSLISWCRNDNRKKARKGKIGWQPK